jgi:thiamine-monophosphate kinase
MRLEAARLPIHPSTRAVAEAAGRDALEWALAGGEDYELLFTAPPARVFDVQAAVARATGIDVTVIGEVTATPERLLVRPDGGTTALAGGWRHFGC